MCAWSASRHEGASESIRSPSPAPLERLVVQLDEVADKAVELASVERIVFSRLNRPDKPALRLALWCSARAPMLPGLVFHDPEGRVVDAGEAKYKRTSDGRGRNAESYQLFAYLTALQLREGVVVLRPGQRRPRARGRGQPRRHAAVDESTVARRVDGRGLGSGVDLAGWLVEHAEAPGWAVLAG